MPVKDSAKDKKRIGLLLKEARQAAKLSQAEVAKAMSSEEEVYHQTQIAKIERGARSVSLAEAIAYMDAVQGDLNHLVTLIDNPNSAKLNAVVNRLSGEFFHLAGVAPSLETAKTLQLVIDVALENEISQDEAMFFVNVLTQADHQLQIKLDECGELLNKYIDVLSAISKYGFQSARPNLAKLESLLDGTTNEYKGE